MIVFPSAKINLGLYVRGKRPDGYHDIESLFLPLPFHDLLEFIPDPDLDRDELTVSGLPVPGALTDNLVMRAVARMHELHDFPRLRIHLHKQIPMGAGLGGGSSDAAFLLTGLNAFFGFGMSFPELEELALSLGSDCPFFIRSTPSIARGRGELLEPCDLSLAGYSLVLLHPGVHVSTREAYQLVAGSEEDRGLDELLREGPDSWAGRLRNDFETPVFGLYPDIRRVKEELCTAGAVYASMTGSGSAVYGIFKGDHPPARTWSVPLVWAGGWSSAFTF